MTEFDHDRVVVRMVGRKFVVEDERVGDFAHHGLRGVDKVDTLCFAFGRPSAVWRWNGVEKPAVVVAQRVEITAFEYRRVGFEIRPGRHCVGVLGRVGVEVAGHQPQRFHRITADGAVEDAVDLPVAVGVARSGCALPVGIGSERIEVQHHDVDVLDAGVDGSVPEGNIFEQAVAQLDGVFRRQSYRISGLLAEYISISIDIWMRQNRYIRTCMSW